jgi:hypothetical protein
VAQADPEDRPTTINILNNIPTPVFPALPEPLPDAIDVSDPNG